MVRPPDWCLSHVDLTEQATHRAYRSASSTVSDLRDMLSFVKQGLVEVRALQLNLL
jgi:hypothetical protein